MKRHIIACSVFKRELQRLGVDDSRVVFLEMTLHDHPANLARKLQQTIDQIENAFEEITAIVLLYGYCGGALIGLRPGRTRLIIPRAHDCIAILMGSNRKYEKLHLSDPHVYYFTPGWIDGGRVPGNERSEYLRNFYSHQYDDPELVEELIQLDKETFSIYKKGIYLDTLEDRDIPLQCTCSIKELGWQCDTIPCDLSWLSSFVQADTVPEHSLVVEPGQQLQAADQGAFFK